MKRYQPDFSRSIRPLETTDLNKALDEYKQSCDVALMRRICANGRNLEAEDGYMHTGHGGLLAQCASPEIANHIVASVNAVEKLIRLLDEACQRINALDRAATETGESL